ncbi:MAG TPA: hypothetical protein VHZ03_46690 [Trebonia sp.]|nr:hypothetical protein [Trebonia sp.]
MEQEACRRVGRGRMPGLAERCRQLTEARADNAWLAGGSVIVQQQAIRDHAQAMARFFAGACRRLPAAAVAQAGRGRGAPDRGRRPR